MKIHLRPGLPLGWALLGTVPAWAQSLAGEEGAAPADPALLQNLAAAHDTIAHLMVTLILGGVALFFLILLILALWLRLRRLSRSAGTAQTAAQGTEISAPPLAGFSPTVNEGTLSPATALPAEAPPAQDNQEAIAALEASKQAIHGLLKNVNEFLEDLLTQNAHYNDRMEQHKVSIRKAMTVAGLEAIERLILTEIDTIQGTSQQYRQELAQAEQQLREQQTIIERVQLDARQDFLTNVPNRRAFDQRLGEELARVQRYPAPLSMLMLDIDHFKRLNDTHGHVAGDKMLQVVAHVIADQVRATDFIARYGGEEFAVLLPETQARQARYVGEKIRRAVEEAGLRLEKSILKVTVSVGAGELADSIEAAEAFIARIDAALYKAKETGRNRVVLAAAAAGSGKPSE